MGGGRDAGEGHRCVRGCGVRGCGVRGVRDTGARACATDAVPHVGASHARTRTWASDCCGLLQLHAGCCFARAHAHAGLRFRCGLLRLIAAHCSCCGSSVTSCGATYRGVLRLPQLIVRRGELGDSDSMRALIATNVGARARRVLVRCGLL